MMKKAVLCVWLALSAGCFCFAQNLDAEIEALREDARVFIRLHPVAEYILVREWSPETGDVAPWERFVSAEHTGLLVSQLHVYYKDGKVLAVVRSETSPSGDWYTIVHYYFRPNGNTAAIDFTLTTWAGGVEVSRIIRFDQAGRRIDQTETIHALETGELVPPDEAAFLDVPVEIFCSFAALKKELELPAYIK